MQRVGARCRQADVKLVATLTMQLAYRNKDKLSAGMIIGGWDRKLGAQVYGIPLGGSMQKVPFTVGGSGSDTSTAGATTRGEKTCRGKTRRR